VPLEHLYIISKA